MTPLLAAVAAMAVVGGLILLFAGLRRTAPRVAPTGTVMISGRMQRLVTRPGRFSPRTRMLLLVGGVAGLLVWLLSGWLVAVLILPVAFAGLPVLLGKPRGVTSIARLEAMEEWTRGLAGVLTVGVGLEQAIIATLRSTPEAIRPEVATLVARLRARWMTGAALRAFADDLDDATGDLIAASLLLGAERRGAGLASVLEGLAQTVAEDVRIRRAIEADRAKPRTTARWITYITIGALVLFALNGTYIKPYGTVLGQLILLLLLGFYVTALAWMRSLAQGAKLPRFIGAQAASNAGQL
ncbi:MAG: type II secretion system F family protein [Actinomycetota bacterium]|nr:type II secretion system F family protein [Actinomycetota bacterium]